MPKFDSDSDDVFNSSDSDSDNLKVALKKPSKVYAPPKRRGRPKKNLEEEKAVSSDKKTKSNQTTKQKEESIVLHLPVFDDDDESSEKNNFTMMDDTETGNKITTILSISDESSDSDKKTVSVQQLLVEMKKKDEIIKKLGKTVSDMKTVGFDNTVSATRESKSSLMDLKLIDVKTGKPCVKDSTNIVCWWDTCPFDTIPFFLPDKYCGTTYYVFGNFCSLNCALAYNADMDDYRSNIRTSLIKKMHQQIFGSTECLVAAHDRELLTKFGGHLSIDEFRSKALLLKKELKIKLPPMIPLLPVVEETTRDVTIIVPSKVHQYKGRIGAKKD